MDWFPIDTQVEQGYVMFFYFLNIIIACTMRNKTNAWRGLRWKFTTALENTDYADGMALLSSGHKDLQEKYSRPHQAQGTLDSASKP